MAIDYVIGESYTLPSKGLIYDVKVNPNVKLKSMTTAHEMLRLSPSQDGYKNLAEIIDDCLVEDIGISSYDLHIGDFQYLLHRLRVVTYGPNYSLTCKCPLCLAESSDTINLDDLKVKYFTEDILKYFELDLPVTKKHITLRMQTPRLLDIVSANVRDFKKRAPNYKGDSAFLFTIKSLIKEIDGEKPDPLKVEDFIQDMPLKDTKMILNYAQKINEGIGLDLNLEVTCDVCGLTYGTTFRTTSEFFGPKIDI